MASGTKFDEGKLRHDLIPGYAVEMLASVLTFGSKKYGDRNWEKGIAFNRLIGSTFRHLWSFVMRNDIDKESGLPHLAHALCNIAMLLHFTKYGKKELDNRPVYGQD